MIRGRESFVEGTDCPRRLHKEQSLSSSFIYYRQAHSDLNISNLIESSHCFDNQEDFIHKQISKTSQSTFPFTSKLIAMAHSHPTVSYRSTVSTMAPNLKENEEPCTSFVAAANKVVDIYCDRDVPIQVASGRPRYCRAVTYRVSKAEKATWATLWRSGVGPENNANPIEGLNTNVEAVSCGDPELRRELKTLADQGPDGPVKEIKGFLWMFEELHRAPQKERKTKLSR